MRVLGRVLALTALVAGAVSAQAASKLPLYNNLDGDGSVELDHAIKHAYAARYTIIDTRRADGYVEPSSTAGDLPKVARDSKGQYLAGYVLAVYIVDKDGSVIEPTVVRSTDDRLGTVALQAMAQWHFVPGRLNGSAVATTAAQEFNFGPPVAPTGYQMTRLVVYQDNPTLLRRLPGRADADAYLDRMTTVARHFFVGDLIHETFHIIVMVRPSGRTRIWFLSSIRPGSSAELEPLRRLLLAVAPLQVKEGPVILAISGDVMGGDGNEFPEDRNPIPDAWRDLEMSLKEPLPIYSDAFLNLVWPDTK
jgi:Gram-negative bacterial TonB protein C-terminal